MARVPYVDREEMDAEGQAIYDRIRQDRNAQQVGLQFRALPEDLKEFVICVVAREWNSDIEWTAHAALAAKAGVSAGSLEAVRTGKAPAGLDDREQLMLRFVYEISRKKNVSDETFASVEKLLGTKGAVDLTLTCAYYTAINMAQVALKPDMEPGKASTL